MTMKVLYHNFFPSLVHCEFSNFHQPLLPTFLKFKAEHFLITLNIVSMACNLRFFLFFSGSLNESAACRVLHHHRT
jgi:hypothetical protein